MTSREMRNWLLANGIASETEMCGCTATEIEDLESVIGNRLPSAYRQFLLAVGHGAGPFLRGTDITYDQLSWLTGAANDLLAENGFPDRLPNNAFVFYMHQGYEFGYFLLGAGEDPIVYQYVEGKGPPTAIWQRFSEYFIDMIRVHSEILKMSQQDQ